MFDNSSCVCQPGFNGEFCETGMINFCSKYMSPEDFTLVSNLLKTYKHLQI